MYCVLCGIALNDSNRQGIICLTCKKSRQDKKTVRTPLRVRYCFNCGIAYEPEDQSIQHCRSDQTTI